MACPWKEISERLGITISAVYSYLFNIKKKFDLDGHRIQLKRFDVDINANVSRIKFSSRTTKDYEVFMMILEGMTDYEICERLSMTYRAVRHQREKMLIRNNCSSMQDLISIFYGEKRFSLKEGGKV